MSNKEYYIPAAFGLRALKQEVSRAREAMKDAIKEAHEKGYKFPFITSSK